MMFGRNKRAVQWSWGLVLAWFSASLLSQAAYLGKYGTPYDGTMLIESLGQWSWLLFIIEGMIWLIVGNLIYQKFQNVRKSKASTS